MSLGNEKVDYSAISLRLYLTKMLIVIYFWDSFGDDMRCTFDIYVAKVYIVKDLEARFNDG